MLVRAGQDLSAVFIGTRGRLAVTSMILRKTGGTRPGIYRFLLVKINIDNLKKGRWECGGRPMGGVLGPRAAPGGGTLSIPAAL